MSNAPLTVSLNEERPHDLSVAPSFTTTGTFTVELENLGQAVHVHLNIDDELSRVVTLTNGNHFVNGGQTKTVTLSVTPPSEPVTGKLKIVSGYGSQTAYVDVTVTPGTGGKPPVEIDDTLSKPARAEPDQGLVGVFEDVFPDVDPRAAPLLVLAGVALVLAFVVASVFDSTAITLSAVVVVGGVFAALVLAVW
ncbi:MULTISPECIES: hypothetical protein [Haloferax]|uniref:Uncharacterized protein n=2 Tax=Haloferax TaxID=2251 RepID=A0A6G1Z4N1_9EURY|nr:MULTISPECIES: hypothetical protein [Haloferax]KAB1188804.1 hypothetical protein Hfx1149_12470 [Haloferax sp. CBA1149]MRW81519.1 hypothetical protein [Haloferax marinisediminis]